MYTVNYIDYDEGDGLDDGDSPSIVTWQFKLGQSRSPPSTPSFHTFGLVFLLQSFLPVS